MKTWFSQRGVIRWLVAILIGLGSANMPGVAMAQRETGDPYFRPEPTRSRAPRAPEDSGFSLMPVTDAGTRTETLQSAQGDSRSGQTSTPGLSGRVATAKGDSDSQPAGEPFEPGFVLAIVGGEPIFVGDLMLEANQLIEQFAPDAPESVKAGQRRELIKRLLPKYIDQKRLLIDTKRGLPEGADFDKIVEQASKEFDEKALPEIMKQNGVTSTAELDAQLRARGSSLRKLRESWSIDQLVRYFLSQKLKIDTEISHQELLNYYNEHREDFEIKARARWQQVMVEFKNHRSRREAKRAIVEMGNQIVYGADMEAVAKKGSDGFRADEGGVHDWTTQGSLVLKELDQAIFSLPVGELSDIIETDRGYHIVRVLERSDAGSVPFTEAQVQIRKKLEEEKRLAALEEHLSKLREEIPVEVYELPSGKPSVGR